ncbi:MAG: membrane protein insertase YidC [Myxococcales bacterium]|nr:membrane protein insertase YidC [Myxococcales bacterium]MDD9968637.1 membrane protein insertase YidC [Myxococcales bacterium]
MSHKGKLLYYGVLLAVAIAVPYFLVPEIEADNETDQAGAQANRTPEPAAKRKPSTRITAGHGGASQQDTQSRKAKQQLYTLSTDSFSASISNLNTGLTKLELTADRYTVEGKPLNLVTTDKERYLPLSFTLDGVDFGASPIWEAEQLDKDRVAFTWEGNGLRLTRRFEAGDGPYQLWITTTVENRSNAPRELRLSTHTFHYVAKASEKSPIPFLPVQSPSRSSAVCQHGEEVEREEGDSLVKEEKPKTFKQAKFAAAANIYFMQALAPDSGTFESCTMWATQRGRDADGEPLGTLFEISVSRTPTTVEAGKSATMRTLAYLGPKTPRELAAAGHSLENAIDTGWFSVLAKFLTFMLRLIYDFIGNWGVAIILLTFIVKTLLYPLTAKQMKSMARMKELKPEMDRINELYADDREKKGAAMMELYRKRGINPMAGCFPMLVQLPIWFSLYTSLSTNVELFRAPFALWWTDLSAPDPYFALPLALGALMFVQQKMTPATAADPMQQKMMLYMMPTMITSFMLFLPAGLCLYMFTNSALSIGQQRLIERQLATAGHGPKADAPEISTSTDSDDETDGPGTPAKRFKTSRPSKAERRSRRGK